MNKETANNNKIHVVSEIRGCSSCVKKVARGAAL